MFGPAAAALAPLVIVILVLLFRPKGILGHD
jgi:branched-subunit amino acid ABC-type transport system permease component